MYLPVVNRNRYIKLLLVSINTHTRSFVQRHLFQNNCTILNEKTIRHTNYFVTLAYQLVLSVLNRWRYIHTDASAQRVCSAASLCLCHRALLIQRVFQLHFLSARGVFVWFFCHSKVLCGQNNYNFITTLCRQHLQLTTSVLQKAHSW